jgi:hypothetical protein
LPHNYLNQSHLQITGNVDMHSIRIIRKTVLLTLCLIGSGCSTMSQDECMVADWQLIGREDGAAGRDASYIGNRRKACSEYGVVPDLAEYKKGYEDGLNIYCDEYNGFKQGEQGVTYNGACPAHLEPAFLNGYNEGREIYLLKSRINQAKSSISKNENNLKDLDKDIKVLEDGLIADETTSDMRRELLEDLKEKQEQHGSLETENKTLVVEAARLEGELKGLGYGRR